LRTYSNTNLYFMRYILTTLLSIALLIAGYQGLKLSKLAQEQKEYKEVLAELNKINYGLFNMQLWKDKAMDIFEDRLQHFAISPQAYVELEKELSFYIKQLYNEYIASGKLVNQFVDEAERDGKLTPMFAQIIKDNVGGQLKDMGIESNIPILAKTLTEEIKANEPRIKDYLRESLKDMLFVDEQKVQDRRMPIFLNFGHQTIEDTNEDLRNRVITLEKEINGLIKIVYLILLVIVGLSLIFYSFLQPKISISLITAASIVLLLLGVTMPMIDIDARLNDFRMDLVGNEVSFDEQYLYYQSKSILEVTETLIQGRGIDLKIVGILILLFSIVVPFVKLVLSSLFLYSRKLANSKVAKAVIYHLGKWSMADVFVVAMFMAYIGFYGIVTAQLGDIGRNQTGYAVETLNYSRLSPGALFFTTYSILSIITGVLIKYWEKNQNKPEVRS